MIKIFLHRILKNIALALLSLALVSCAPEDVETPVSKLRIGTVQTVKSYGEYFKSEIINIDDNIVVWENRWDEHFASKHKVYQNIFSVWELRGETSYFYSFGHSELDALFPLKVGNEVMFEGMLQRGGYSAGLPFWAKIEVEKNSQIVLEGTKYDVLVINITIEYQTAEGPSRSKTTLWHAVDIGINLKTKYHFDGRSYTANVVKLRLPDGRRDDGGNVGTTLINHSPAVSKQEQLIVLNEAQF